MKKSVLLLFFLTGCSTPTIPVDNPAQLSDNELCTALGEYNDDATQVLRLTEEVSRRGNAIDQQRCYELSHQAMPVKQEGASTEPYAEHIAPHPEYDHQKKRWINKPEGVRAGLHIIQPD